MTIDGTPPVPASPALLGGAEDPIEDQHPVLQRLRTGSPDSAAVRTSAVWAISARVGAQVIQFVGLVISARLLVPSDYGAAAVVVPVLVFGNQFATLGMASAVIHARRVTERLLSTAFFVNTAAAVVVTCVVAGLAVPLSRLFAIPTLAPLLLLASLLFLLNMSIVHLALLERTLRFKAIAIIEVASVVLSVITVVTAAALGAGPFALVLGPMVNQASITVCVWAVVRWRPRAWPDRTTAGDLWAYSRGITGFNILNFWSRYADNLLLARFVSLSALGNYNRAYSLMRLPLEQMHTMMARVLFPAMTRLRDDRPRLGAAWLRALSVAAALTAPVTLGMAVAAPALVEVLFGTRWLGMVAVLQLFGIAALPQTITTTAGSILRAVGATDQLFRLGLLTSSATVLFVLAGLPWGTLGVATALLVKFYAEVPVVMRPCLRELELRWSDLWRATRGVWCASLAMAGAGVLVRLALQDRPAAGVLVAQLLVCGLVYVGALWCCDRRTALEVVRLTGRAGRSSTPAAAGGDAPSVPSARPRS